LELKSTQNQNQLFFVLYGMNGGRLFGNYSPQGTSFER